MTEDCGLPTTRCWRSCRRDRRNPMRPALWESRRSNRSRAWAGSFSTSDCPTADSISWFSDEVPRPTDPGVAVLEALSTRGGGDCRGCLWRKPCAARGEPTRAHGAFPSRVPATSAVRLRSSSAPGEGASVRDLDRHRRPRARTANRSQATPPRRARRRGPRRQLADHPPADSRERPRRREGCHRVPSAIQHELIARRMGSSINQRGRIQAERC